MSDSMKQTLEMAQRAKSLGRARKRFLIFFTAALLALLFCLFLIEEFFVVKNIVVKSNSPIYTEEEVIAATGLSPEQKMFSFSAEETRMEMLRKLPYFSGVQVKKVYPSTVEITFEEIPGTMYVDANDEHYILAPDFTVIARASEEDLARNSRIHVITEEVVRCVVGESLVLRDEAQFELLKTVYAALSEEEITPQVEYLDATNRFHIALNVSGRWDVDLGDSSELVYKVKMFKGVIESASAEFGPNTGGKIDVTNAREAILQRYSDELSES